MTIPTTIRIAGVSWPVVEMSQGELYERTGKDLLGQCDWTTGEFQIKQGMRDDRAGSILLHEIVHAILDNADCEVTEAAARVVSCGLIAVLRDNPEFTRFLLGATEQHTEPS
jgi:hypothetical protein